MARTKWILAAAALTVAIAGGFLLSKRRPEPAGVPAGGTASAGLARGGELVASFRTEPATHNRYVDRTAAAELESLLTHAPLVHVDRATDTLEPWLAESWTQSSDGTVYTLKLRQGVTFSDGAPFTSADVVFSFAALYDPRVNAVFASDTYVNGDAPESRGAGRLDGRHPAPGGVRARAAADRGDPHPPAAQAAAGPRRRHVPRRLVGRDPPGRDCRPGTIRARRACFGAAPGLRPQPPVLAQGRRGDPAPVPGQAHGADRARSEHRSAADADGGDRSDGERRNPPRRLRRVQAHRRAGAPPADRRRRRARSQRAVVQPLPRRTRRTRAARGSARKPFVRPSPARSTGRASSTPSTSARRSPSTDRLRRPTGCGIPSRDRRAIAIPPKRVSSSPRPA